MSLTYLLPTCGRKAYLKWALASLEAQTAPWNLIVFDNASGDGSDDILRDFCQAYDCTYLRANTFHDDGGHTSACRLLDAWDGEGIATMLHDDDMCHPERTRRLLDHEGNHDLYVTAMHVLHDGQEHIALAGQPTGQRWDCSPSVWAEGLHRVIGNTTTPTTAWNARYLDVPRHHGYKSGANDTLSWFHAARMGLDIGYIPEALYYYRFHESQTSRHFYDRDDVDFNEEVARMYEEAAEIVRTT